MTNLNTEQLQWLEDFAELAAERKHVTTGHPDRRSWERAVALTAKAMHEAGIPAARVREAYGTKDPYTIKRLIDRHENSSAHSQNPSMRLAEVAQKLRQDLSQAIQEALEAGVSKPKVATIALDRVDPRAVDRWLGKYPAN